MGVVSTGVCLQHCPVILTDHNPIVLKVLERNAELNKGDHSIRCQAPASYKWPSAVPGHVTLVDSGGVFLG